MTPKSKPKNYSKILDMLNTEDMAKSLSPKTYVNLVGEYSRKAFDNGEISEKEYMRIVRPLFGDAGIMATKKIDAYQKELERYATGGRVNYNEGSKEPDISELSERIKEIMDIEKKGFNDAFEQAVRELNNKANGGRIGLKEGGDYWAMVTRKFIELGGEKKTGMTINKFAEEYFPRLNQKDGTMPKSERWMRDYFFSGKGGYDDRMSYQEFALGPGQELYKRFSND
jgi:hypothetical protein